MKCLMKCFEVRRYLFLLIMLFCLITPSIHLTAEDKGEKEAEQALEDFQKLMEEGKETKSFEETEKKYEEGTKARSRLFKLGKSATPVLVRAIKTKEFSEDFRGACIDILYKIGDERAIEPLIELSRDETEIPRLRDEALYGLGAIGGPEVLDIFLEALKHSHSSIRRGGLDGIWGLVGRKVVEFPVDAVVDLAENDDDIWVRGEAVASLGLGGEKAVQPLLGLMNDEDRDIRLEAYSVLGIIGDERAVDPLIAILDDEHTYERSTAIIALGDIGDRRAVEALIKILQKATEESGWRYAAEALAKIGDMKAIEPLKIAIEKERKVFGAPSNHLLDAYKKLTGKEYRP